MLGFATVTVVAPIQLEAEDNSYLSGCYISSFASGNNERASHVVVITCAGSHLTSPIGRINNEKRSGGHSSSRSVWVDLQTQPHVMLQSVTILQKNVSLSEVNLVLYDSREISESELVGKKFLYEEEKDHGNDIVPYFVHCVQRESRDHETRVSRTRESWTKLLLLIIRSFLVLSWLPKIALGSLHSVLVKRFDYSSSALQQLLLRITQIETLEEELLAGSVERLLQWLSGVPAGLKLNQPLTQALSAFFSYHVHLWRLYLELADPLLRSLAWVLVWLGMCGASVQVAILSDLLDLATLHLYCFYVYGARIHMLQISLLGSQWRAFRGRKWNPLKQRVDSHDKGGHVSLTRVLTAVVFTLVIFLLPTTTIYYLVFVLLRVGLNLMRGAMSLTVWLLNINPLYLVLLNLSASNRVKGDIYFSTVSAPEVNKHSVCPVAAPLVLHLHTWPTALSEVLVHAHTDDFPPKPSPDWKLIFSSIMFGENLL
ncbi:phosphatidylinositol N-acetylglucosaminyltransferase subunit Q-like isoform X2 [Homarus americanus]|uniref:phosphatidylinositol N-acetylglucosaminyltransferase subunit Q-like isoform X2 n=1 Tax=Homarus americanus TaxID=6706 RepID=UPI001C454F58|nr:phosphatidylinositol N-acetylglucosaminyltransferase subunit Q-like isoform X2 [Homarus americanus]